MEYIRITREEYEMLLRYRDVVQRIEEEIHEELNVKPLKDPRAMEKLSKLDQEVKKGKRKKYSKEEFLAEFGG